MKKNSYRDKKLYEKFTLEGFFALSLWSFLFWFYGMLMFDLLIKIKWLGLTWSFKSVIKLYFIFWIILFFISCLIPKLSTFIYEESDIGSELNTLTYSLGGLVLIEKKKVGFSTGITLSRISANQVDNSLVFACDIDPVRGIDLNNSYTKDNFKIHYLGIPLNFYAYLTKKNNLYLNLGGEFLFKINDGSTTFLVECGDTETEISDNPLYTPMGLILKSNFGIGYLLKYKQYSIFFEPVVEYSITNIFNEAGIVTDITNNMRSLEYGLRIGFKI